jgi:hypothetical protein
LEQVDAFETLRGFAWRAHRPVLTASDIIDETSWTVKITTRMRAQEMFCSRLAKS